MVDLRADQLSASAMANTLRQLTCPDGISVEDLQYFAAQWLTDDCSAFNQYQGTDLDNSDNVDLADFVVFANQWMKEI